MKRHPLLFLLLGLTPLNGQDNGIEQSLEFTTAPTGESILRWDGKTGRSYFIQVSDAANHLGKWNWAPIIESGNDEEISYEVDATADKGFFRLKHTDLALDPGETVDTSDFDKDGISNSGEVIPPPSTIGGATDPLNADTDGDGLNDGFERNNGFNPNNSDENENGIPDGEDDNDGDGLTNAEEQTLGTNPDNADTDNDGIPDKDETTNGTNPATDDTDGDLAKDGQDADPNNSLVNWPPAPESSYVLIEVTPPAEETNPGSVRDLNDKGEVLFGNGIWSGGDWIPKPHEALTGVLPISTNFPNETSYIIFDAERGWDFFNNDGTAFLTSMMYYSDGTTLDSPAYCPIFLPMGQSAPSIFYETAALWDFLYQDCTSLGISTSGTMAMWVQPYSEDHNASMRIDLFDSTGARTGSIDGTGGYHPMPGDDYGNMTPSGWIVSNQACEATETQPGGYKLGLWNAAGAAVPLPSEAAGIGSPVIATDLPTGKAGLVASVTIGDDVSSRVFLPDVSGHYQYDTNLSGKGLHLFAGDGTAMTDDGKLWRNGKLIPLRDLSAKWKDLEDEGYSFHPFKANKNGTYLIQAQGPDGTTETKLAAPVVIQRDEEGGAVEFKDVTGQLAKALPGQKINLKLDLSRLPKGSTVSNYLWSVTGTKFADYKADQTKGEKFDLNASDLTGSDFHFYWSQPGIQTITVQCTINGKQTSTTQTIDVVNPKSKLTGGIGFVTLHSNKVELSGTSGVGILFRGSVDSVKKEFGGEGHWNFAQLVKGNLKAITQNDDFHFGSHYDEWTYDTKYPYNYSTPNYETGSGEKLDNDSPSVELDGWPVIYKQMNFRDDFKMYLLFLPPGENSKWVPLRVLEWNMKWIAKKDPSWKLTSDSANIENDNNSIPIFDHPVWNANYQPFSWNH